MTANINRDTKKRSGPFRPAEFNPFAADKREPRARRGIPITRENIGILKAAFCGKKQKVKGS